MSTSLREHLQFQITRENERHVLTTLCGPPPESVSSVREECVRAAGMIVAEAKAEGGRPALLLEYSYAGLCMFQAFLATGAEFDVYVINYVNLRENAPVRWAQRLVQGTGVSLHTVDFDFNNEEHLVGVEKIQETTECADLDILFSIWACCHVDSFVVLPGRFVLPRFDHGLRLQGWNLPAFGEHSLFRFFEKFGGVPFFMNYSAELVYAQARSAFSGQLTALAEQKLEHPYNLPLLRHAYAATGFPLADEAEIRFQSESFCRQAVKNCDREKKERLAAIYNRMRKYLDTQPLSRQSLEIMPGSPAGDASAGIPEALRATSRRSDIRGAILEPGPQTGPPSLAEDHVCYAAFPVLLSRHQFRGDLDTVLKAVKELEYFNNQGNFISRTDLHLRPEFSEVVSFFHGAIRFHLQQMAYVYDEAEITQCWANRSGENQSHHHHYHPNCFLSAFFNLTSGGGGSTVFRIGRNTQLEPKRYATTPWSSSAAEVSPEAGKLILFPAHLEHHTLLHQAASPRYTLSFNVMLRGEIGELSSAAWVKI